jgi:DNA-binding transcriptional LysR family regulator
MRLFRAHGLAPTIRMELGSNEAIKEAVLAGLGVTIMSRYTFGLDPESSRFLCLDVEGFPLENHWYFVYPEGKQLSPVVRAFLDFARAEAKGLVLSSLGQR